MSWDRFFEDLEQQLDSEWEAERAALDSEAERLRISRIGLRERWASLVECEAEVSVEFVDGTVLKGPAAAFGADWIATTTSAAVAVSPISSVRSIGVAHDEMLRSARPRPRLSELSDRMTLGFVLRDAARKRIPITLNLLGGKALTGTVDRAGADHLDIALHDAGAPRRMQEVSGFRMVPFSALAWVRWGATRSIP